MSTDGTQPPPSIAPKKPVGGPSVRTADTSPWAPTSNAAAAAQATPRNPTAGSGDPGPGRGATAGTSTEASPSVTERVKRAAQSVAGAAKTAVTDRESGRGTDADRRSEPARTDRDAPRPARKPVSAPTPATGPRRVRLAVARIDPWSVMKLGFLLSVAVGIMIVVAAAVVWYTLDGLAVFTQVNEVIATLSGSTTFFDVLEFVSFERVISLATMIAVVDVVLLTALSTIGAFLYNIVAALVGGIHLTLTDD